MNFDMRNQSSKSVRNDKYNFRIQSAFNQSNRLNRVNSSVPRVNSNIIPSKVNSGSSFNKWNSSLKPKTTILGSNNRIKSQAPIKENFDPNVIKKYFKKDNVDTQLILEPEKLEMSTKHLIIELEDLHQRNLFFWGQSQTLDEYVKKVEREIEEKKNFFLNNDQAKNLLNTDDDDLNDSGLDDQPKDTKNNLKYSKKYDNDVSLLNIMKQKVNNLNEELEVKQKKMEEYYCHSEYTDLFELQIELKEKEAEIDRLDNLVIILDDDQKPTESNNNVGTKSTKVNGKSESASSRKEKEKKENTSLSIYLKDKYNQFVSNNSNKKLKSNTNDVLSNTSNSFYKGNSGNNKKESLNLVNEEHEKFLITHIQIENLRNQNDNLMKELSILSEENNSLSNVINQFKNENKIKEEILSSFQEDKKIKEEKVLYFEKAFRKEVLEDKKFSVNLKVDKNITMMNPKEFEFKIKFGN